METIEIFSVSDKKPKDILYVVMNSVKHSKQDQNVINYHLVVEDVDDKLKQYFSDLESDTFHLHYYEARDYQKKIKAPINSYLYYVRCFAPFIFPHLDKIIYLDTDVFAVDVGIEELWNMELGCKYIAASTDIQIAYNDANERRNTNRDNTKQPYFNSGVMLINLKAWREGGLAQQLEQDLLSWPKGLQCILMDQTLLNYRIGDNMKTISSKWNNSILALMQKDVPAYMSYYGTQNLMSKVEGSKLLHLKGPKVWREQVAWVCWSQVHRLEGQQVFGQIYKEFGKHEEF